MKPLAALVGAVALAGCAAGPGQPPTVSCPKPVHYTQEQNVEIGLAMNQLRDIFPNMVQALMDYRQERIALWACRGEKPD